MWWLEFPSWHSGNVEPWGCGFDPWPRSVGEGSGVAVSCDVGRRRGSDLALLWLWYRLAATARIRPLAWELPYATGVALKRHTHTHTHTHNDVVLFIFHRVADQEMVLFVLGTYFNLFKSSAISVSRSPEDPFLKGKNTRDGHWPFQNSPGEALEGLSVRQEVMQ